MRRSKLLSLAGIFIASLGLIAAVSAQSSVAPEAERVAKVYMTAFFAGDVRTAADLTDPKTLERTRETFFAELVKVTDPDTEKNILANVGLARTTVELSKVDAKTLYIAITESEHRINPQVFETMRRSRVESLGSVPNPAGGVTVQARILAPASAGAKASTKEFGLLMRQVLGDWKVVGNMP